jgi:hypothetical protein
MDVRLALIQDTSNRSWPMDDYTGDGTIGAGDFWPSARITAAARPCTNGRTGVVSNKIDWTCDGVLTSNDLAHQVYAGWLERLSLSLLNDYGSASVQHVFLTQKPLEFGAACVAFNPEPGCTPHAIRTPTSSRPYDHFYHPWVYWEYRAVETLLAKSGLDPRIHLGPVASTRMWLRSADCYAVGITTWSIPASVGRPATIDADDDEFVGGVEVNPSSHGCMNSDHIHHNESGGWLLADVWYEGLTGYLA